MRRVDGMHLHRKVGGPPHPLVLRSIELMADRVAPALGWRRTEARNAA